MEATSSQKCRQEISGFINNMRFACLAHFTQEVHANYCSTKRFGGVDKSWHANFDSWLCSFVGAQTSGSTLLLRAAKSTNEVINIINTSVIHCRFNYHSLYFYVLDLFDARLTCCQLTLTMIYLSDASLWRILNWCRLHTSRPLSHTSCWLFLF